MSRITLVLLALLVVALACWSSYRHGRKVEAGEQSILRQNEIAAAVRAARADVSTQARAEASALKRADAIAARVRQVDREAARLPLRTECDWTPDELRLAAARWCARYADDDPAACSVPHGLPDPASPHEPTQHLGDAN